ncbi:Hpt domain-containing protein [Alkalitalea saponilacus]|uniref:Hpt domain-containing protein n=1 Tax=Alkalitalea saponilacus TaxID=889453 RepID=A0A1T5ECG0_9BACT|nr:Hpt domain-containing protein [Alkalitalea saponilacus]ASB49028.1 hypothetical protein CDL62_07705 [Alkalitalea saponilacus]SKB81797.1 Hpt domain-containing protein [Alkalitalea saponilacus]
MLTEIKQQFYKETLQELKNISSDLSAQVIDADRKSLLVDRIFSVSHQLSGTGPMLGFDMSSKISRKLEKTFYEIRSGEKEVSLQLLWQTKRTIDFMIDCITEENQTQVPQQ